MIDCSGSIRTSADTCHQIIRIIATNLFLQLPFYLFGDDTLQTCYHVGIRMRTNGRTDYIESVFRMTAPVAYGFVGCILESHVSTGYGTHLCTKHLHTLYIDMLSLHIFCTHVYYTWHIHKSADCSCCNTVLTGTGLCNNALLAHLTCQENLTYSIVDLMCTGMVEVFALKVKTTSILFAHATCIIKRRRTSYIVFQKFMVFFFELLTLQYRQICTLKLLYSLIKYFWNVSTTVNSVIAFAVNLIFSHNR